MFEDLIVDQNPHWSGSRYFEGVRRDVLADVWRYLETPHIISIVGVRRAGKSTLARQIINDLMTDRGVPARNILFLNLEHPLFARYRQDVSYLEKAYEDYLKLADPGEAVYCFLDEVQFFPDWQIFVKSRFEGKGVKFILTGSNSRLLSSEFATLLSGRTLPVEVYPFSFLEYCRAKGVNMTDRLALFQERHRLRGLFDAYLREGGFPEAAYLAEAAVRKEMLSMYGRTILYQDIAPRFGVKKPLEMENLFFYLMANCASLQTWNALSKLLGLSDKTIKEYISYFADARLLFAVDAFGFSLKKQINSPKKIYAIDTGMAAAVSAGFSSNTGHYLENMVFLHLKQTKRDVYYYKTASGKEVDFICRGQGNAWELIQVSKEIRDRKTREREIRALKKAMEEMNVNGGKIVTYEEEGEIKDGAGTIAIVPAFKFLLEDGKEWENPICEESRRNL